MIKVPATIEGVAAIEQLLADGIHVNVTLMFSMAHYEAVAQAYLRGVARASNPANAASVASFFVSRVDSLIDKRLRDGSDPQAVARALHAASQGLGFIYITGHGIPEESVESARAALEMADLLPRLDGAS